jgi:tetratricopeptide (TPR) repeat protein
VPPETEAVNQQLERILASGDFDASPRSRALFRFIVGETLAGRQEALTQAGIATRVFGRRDDFDATVDPIVRIQAGRLRRSLERYYLLAGVGDPVRIELPRGTYVPNMRWALSEEGRGRAPDAGPPPPIDDWPSVVLSLFDSDVTHPNPHEAAAQFGQHLAVEMGRYRDARVVFRREQDRSGASPPANGAFALEGHVFREEGRLGLTVRLTDRRTGRQIWAQKYEAAGPSGAFYEDTARLVAAQVASEQGVIARQLWMEHKEWPSRPSTPYGAILRSYQFFFNRDPEDFAPAVEALQGVVAASPDCSLAWVQLSRLYSANYAFEVSPLDTPIGQAVQQADKAVRLDPTGQRASAALAFALFLGGELAASRTEAQRAVALNPDSLVYLESIAWLTTLLGDWERGPALVRRAMARNPHHLPIVFHALWADHLRRGEIEEAYQVSLQYRDPAFFWRAVMRACCLGHLGRIREARTEIADLLRQKPDFENRGRTLIGRLIKLPDLLEKVFGGLRKAGLRLQA